MPGQTLDSWSKTLETTLELRPEHISAYSLSIDAGSLFEKEVREGRLALPGDELDASMYEHAVDVLRRAGYLRYELSNFSLPGYACRHNMNYWRRGEYLGLGPGAWSFIDSKRYHAVADSREYFVRLNTGRSVVEGAEVIDRLQAVNETIMLGLRTAEGVDLDCFGRVFGAEALTKIKRNLIPLEQEGLIVAGDGKILLTERGFLLANEALARLVL